jgi:hypothetical protein
VAVCIRISLGHLEDVVVTSETGTSIALQCTNLRMMKPLNSPCNHNGEGGGKNGKKQDSTPFFGNGTVCRYSVFTDLEGVKFSD